MFGNTYYYQTIRHFIIYFGALFNNIYINREAQPYAFANVALANNENIETIKIPVSYAPKEKFLSRVEGDPALTKPIAISLPRIAYQMMTLEYDATRALNKMNVLSNQANSTTMNSVQSPSPWNFNFTMWVMVKNAEDGTKIIEQILPNFRPEWTARMNLLPAMGTLADMDIPLVLNTVDYEDTFDEGDFTKRRQIVWTLKFTLKGWLFGQIMTQPQIKQIFVNFRIPYQIDITDANPTNTPIADQIFIEPGMDANGNPTTNSQLTIPSSAISANDNWTYIIEYLDPNSVQ